MNPERAEKATTGTSLTCGKDSFNRWLISKIIFFESDSKSDIGKGDGLIARRARKLVILNKEQIKKWDEIKYEIMLNIWRAKYSQCDIAKEVLMATNNAELWHGMPRSKPIRQTNLELVRKELSFI